MANLSDFQAKYANVMQDVGSILSTSDRDAFISEAVKSYAIDRPLVKVLPFSGNGGFEYNLPPDWIKGFSVIKKIEYPVGYQNPVYIGEDDFLVYQGEASEILRFLNQSPGTNESFILTYTTLHTVDVFTSTVPIQDQDAVINLAGALACYAMARNLAQNMDTDLDPVTIWRSVNRYKEQGQTLETLYRNHVSGAVAPPASLTFNWSLKPSWRQRGIASAWQTKTD